MRALALLSWLKFPKNSFEGLYFIPKALMFERAHPKCVDEALARAWTRRSQLRLVLDVVTCFGIVNGFAAAVRLF